MILLSVAMAAAGCSGGGGGGEITVTNTQGEVIQISPDLSTITISPPGATPVANGVDQVQALVTVRDVQGRPVANLEVSVQVSGSGNILSQPTGTTNLQGQASATLASTVAELKTCTGFIGGVEIPQTGSVTFVAGPPTRLAFQVPPSTVVQDTCMVPPVVVAALDAFGNVATSAAGDVTMSLGQNPGSGSLVGVVAATPVAGLATFDALSVDMPADGYTLTASSPGLQGAASVPFNVLSGIGPGCGGGLPTAARAAFVQQPGTSAAGAPFQVQVALQDSFGTTLTNRTDTITLSLSTNPTGDTLQGTLTAAAVNGVATFSGLALQKASSGYRLGAAAGGFVPGTSDPFEIQAGAADHVQFLVQPSNAQAGAAITPGVQVALKDAFGNTRTQSSDSVTVALQSNPGGATLSGTLTVAAAQGVATFSSLSLNRPGVGYTLAASATGYTGAASQGFDITPGAPDHLAFLVQPGETQAGRAMDPAPQVALQDAFDNLIPSGGVTVRMALGTNPSMGTLTGDVEVATVNGVATFSNLKIDKVGTGYTLAATATGFSGLESQAFNVIPGQANGLQFSTQPPAGPTEAGSSFSTEVSVVDSEGNLVTSSTAPVQLALLNNSSGATLSGTLLVNAVGGTASFPGLSVDKAQTGYTLAATSAGLVGAESTAFAITHSTADHLAFRTQPGNGAAGAATTAGVAMEDRFGNVVTSDQTTQITMALGTNPTMATLGGTLQRTLSNGQALFDDLTVQLAGTYTLMASGGGFTAESGSFTVGSAAPSRLVFLSLSNDIRAGQVFSAQVQAQDAFGNPATTWTTPITLTLGGGNPNAPGTLGGTNPRTPSGGTATFDDLTIDVFASNYTLTASSGALTTAVVDPLVVGLPSTPFTWYVDNTAGPGGIGVAVDPFDTLADAQTASRAGDTIVVRLGDGTTTGYASGITLKDNQTLSGASNPIIGPVTLASNDTVQNLRVTNPAGIAVTHGAGAAGGLLSGVTARDSLQGIVFNGAAGTWTFNNVTVPSGIANEAVSLTASPTATFQINGLTLQSGKGLVAANAGTLEAIGTNSVTAAGAPALNLSGTALGASGVTFATLTSTNSTSTGMSLDGLSGPGAFTASGNVNLDGPTLAALRIQNCPNLTFTFNGTVTVTNGASVGLDLATNNGGAAFNFSTLAVTNASGAGVLAGACSLSIGGGTVTTSGAPCLDLNGTTLTGGGVNLGTATSTNSTGRAVRLASLAGQALTMSGGTLSGAAQTAFDVQGGSASISYGGTLTNTTAAARVVEVAGRTGGTVTLSGSVSDTGGTGGGVRVANPAGSVVFSGSCSLTTGAGVSALDIGNTGGSLGFPNGGLAISASGAGGVGINLTGSGVATLSGSNTLQASAGAIAFKAAGGTANLDFNGNLTHTSTARAVDIQNTTGGAIRFQTGSISSQGGSGGIFIGNCGGTVSFNTLNLGNTTPLNTSVPVTIQAGTGAVSLGQVALATTGAVQGISATTTAGQISSTGGTVTSTSGTAVFIDGPANRTPLNMVLTRVSSNGASNGLLLRDVQGTFTVNGDGGTSANGSGGTIQNGASGVLLERATGVTLRQMNLTGHSDFGLQGSTANNLSLQFLSISNCGDSVGDAGTYLLDPRGTTTVTNCLVTASATGDQAARIAETSGGATQSTVNIQGSTFKDTYTSAIGSDALEVQVGAAGNLLLNVTGSLFTNTRTNGLQFLVQGAGQGDVNVTNSTFTEVGTGLDLAADGTAVLDFDINGNPQIQTKSGWGTNLVNLFTAGSADVAGFIRNNPNMTGAGATVAFGQGIRLNVNENSTAVVSVTGNTLQSVPVSGIQGMSRAGGTGRLDLTVLSNTVVNAPVYGIELVAQDTNTLYANVANNNCNTAGTAAFRVRPADAGSTIFLQGYAGNVTTLWDGNGNTPTGSVSTSGLGSIQAGTPQVP